MYCTSCGKEIEEGQTICEVCEAKMKTVEVEEINADNKGQLLKMFLGAVGLQVLQIILWFCNFAKVEMYGFSESMSMHGFSIEAGQMWRTIVTVIIYIVSIVLLFLPVLRNTLHKRHRMIAPILLSLWGVWYSVEITLFVLMNNGGQSGLNCRLTLAGWLIVLAQIAIVVIYISISRKTAKNSKRKD